ncbi:hypothetical protein ACFL3Q_08720 [Planctomycetota bacterium]
MRNVKNLTAVAALIIVALLAFPSISGSGLFDHENETVILDDHFAAEIASTDRISGVKTFFTILQPGSMNFLDEQITRWLTENPGVAIKQTNVTVGEVEGDKKEPNIIINVWY